MFTGIIEEVGRVTQIVNRGGKKYFTLACNKIIQELKIGDSISCNGICLTLTNFTNTSITIEAMNETISKTTVKEWQAGSRINLERALKFNSRLDGHIVQGHVDTVANILTVKELNQTRYIEISLSSEHAELVVPQGSIAINGVSLTIAHIGKNSFQVALISLTEDLTNLSLLQTGHLVNLEFDLIGKYILRQSSLKTQQSSSKISKAWLHENGF